MQSTRRAAAGHIGWRPQRLAKVSSECGYVHLLVPIKCMQVDRQMEYLL